MNTRCVRGRKITTAAVSWLNVSNLSASRTHMILGTRLPILDINLQRKASEEAWQLVHRGGSG